MSLVDLFVEYGNPADTYSDEVLARFLADVDDGSMFLEALGELTDAQRIRVAELVNDQYSRTLSQQMTGEIINNQLRRYVKDYLVRKYDELRDKIEERKREQSKAAADDLKFEEFRQKAFDQFSDGNWMP